MKLIESSVEYIPQEPGMNGLYKHIEKCARTCYKSDVGNDPKAFVDRLINSGHTAMLEHGTVYLKRKDDGTQDYYLMRGLFHTNPYSKFDLIDGNYFVTTNLRVILESYNFEWLKYLCEPTGFHEKRYTFKFTIDRGISHELVRHRVMSFAQESQRFCAYMKEKFGMSVTFIQPEWILSEDQKEFEEDLKLAESLYSKWISKGYKPEQARYFLINGTKTEICVTGFASDWKYLLDLRLFGKTGKPHPDMIVLMEKLKEVAKENNIWNNIWNDIESW